MAKKSISAKKGAKGSECRYDDVASANEAFVIEIYSANCVFPGTTLFAHVDHRHDSEIWEVDFTGRIVWKTAASNYFSMPKGGYVMDVERLTSGNILFNVKNYGAFEVSRDHKVVWKHTDNAISHDVDRLPNGNTLYVRGWVSKGEDLVREVDPGGKLVWAWNGRAHYDKPPYDDIDEEGWLHANAVTRLPNGNTLVSLRNIDRTAEVDPAGAVLREIVYGQGAGRGQDKGGRRPKGGDSGAVLRPHDPEILPDGNILVTFPARGRVVEATGDGRAVRVVGQWDTNVEYFHFRDANRLPNGNTLLVGYERILELNRAGDIVWSLRKKVSDPVIKNGRRLRGLQSFDLYKAQRIAPDGTAYGG